eukprot:UN31988
MAMYPKCRAPLNLALEHAKEAKKSDPEWHRGYGRLGKVLAHQQKWAGAVREYTKAIEKCKKVQNDKTKDHYASEISKYSRFIERCEKQKGEVDEEQEEDSKLQKLPIYDAIPDFKLLYGQNPFVE